MATDGIGDGLHAVARPEIRSQENKKTVSKESKSNVARIRLQKISLRLSSSEEKDFDPGLTISAESLVSNPEKS